MIKKRILATIIDIAIAIVSILPLYFLAKYNIYKGNIIHWRYLFIIAYLSHTIIMLIISRKFTIGGLIMKIKIVDIEGKELPLKKLLLRHLTFSNFIVVIVIYLNDMFNLLLFSSLFIMINALIFQKNKFNLLMNGFDHLFKTTIVEDEEI